jgi:uncharacterized protein (AIM24 family)
MNNYPAQTFGGPPTTPRSNVCTWCGTVNDGTPLSCPACGATLNVAANRTQSGWTALPGRKDMAKLQIGHSSCQIEGMYVPVADMALAAEDSVYFAHHVLLWKDAQVTITNMSMKGAWKRALAGMPVIMTQAQGPGHIAFSRDAPGEMVALPIQPGQSVDAREHMLVVATSNVAYDFFWTNVWFNTQSGDETETHYPLGQSMDRFIAKTTPGLVILHAAGNVFVRNLAPRQSILIKPTALLFKDSTVNMNLHIEMPNSPRSFFGGWNHRYLWLQVTGPGRVAVQSAFEPIEDDGNTITSTSAATQHRW